MRVKRVTPYLRPGDTIRAVVRECLDNNHLIVSFAGDLLNVSNKTHQMFRVGEVISLRVESVRPLSFKVLSERFRETSWRA